MSQQFNHTNARIRKAFGNGRGLKGIAKFCGRPLTEEFEARIGRVLGPCSLTAAKVRDMEVK